MCGDMVNHTAQVGMYGFKIILILYKGWQANREEEHISQLKADCVYILADYRAKIPKTKSRLSTFLSLIYPV